MLYKEQIAKLQGRLDEKDNMVEYVNAELDQYERELENLQRGGSTVDSPESPRSIAIRTYQDAIGKTKQNIKNIFADKETIEKELKKLTGIESNIEKVLLANRRLAELLKKIAPDRLMEVRDDITRLFMEQVDPRESLPSIPDTDQNRFQFSNTLPGNTIFKGEDSFDGLETADEWQYSDDPEDIEDTMVFNYDPTRGSDRTVIGDSTPAQTIINKAEEEFGDSLNFSSTDKILYKQYLTKNDFLELGPIKLKAIALVDEDLNDDAELEDIANYLQELNVTQKDLDELLQNDQVVKYINLISQYSK